MKSLPSRYDTIGVTYAKTRRPDPRITERLVTLLSLPKNSVVADIGAGVGNYANMLAHFGYIIRAIEPSAVMRAQARHHPHVEWYEGTAEEIPLPTFSVDGVICTLALHHFADAEQAVREMTRVVRDGPIVIFTFDPRAGIHFWLFDYFPGIYLQACREFPPLETLIQRMEWVSRRRVTVHEFPLPHNLRDLFCAAGWRQPSIYLEPAARAGISSFATLDKYELARGLKQLRTDLKSGEWIRRYGMLLNRTHLDVGYRFLVLAKRR